METSMMELAGQIFSRGVRGLSDSELLALLMTSGPDGSHSMRDLAEQLLQVGGGLKALCLEEPQELCQRTGVDPQRAAQLLAALELGRRAQYARETRPRLRSAEDIYHYLVPHLGQRRKEMFRVLCFNSRNVLLRDEQVAEGTMNACPVDPRDVFHVAISARATAIVVAHNHPSGDSQPSSQDCRLTKQLVEGSRLLGFRLLDHVIVGDGEYSSFMEQGLLPLQGISEAKSRRKTETEH